MKKLIMSLSSLARKFNLNVLLVLAAVLLGACGAELPTSIPVVTVIVDGTEMSFQMPETMTVEQFLAEVNIEVRQQDALNPPRFTQLTDGMRITIVRVEERTECENVPIPYESETIFSEELGMDEVRTARTGQDGEQRICYRVIIRDGVQDSRLQVGEPTIIQEPVNELIVVGIDRNPEPVPIPGTLAYINNQNAWVMNGTSLTKRQLTGTSNLDGLVLSLSMDGRYLLFTKEPEQEDAFVNELWVIDTLGDKDPVPLVLTDVLHAEWVPGQNNVISYSTGEIENVVPYWRALNNLWTTRIDPVTGQSFNPRLVIPESVGGLAGWWGTVYGWSPTGDAIAWVRADSVGLFDPNQNEAQTLAEYALFRTSQNWSWRSTVSWSWDGELLAATVHGPPLNSEPPESSPIFNIAIMDRRGDLQAKLVDSAGMWAAPQFSPRLTTAGGQFERGYIAYLRARDPYNTVNGEYDLVVADRDGSNARAIFPPPNQTGIRSRLSGLTSRVFTWSPDGSRIAVIYQGNLWVVDIDSAAAYQLTFDGQSHTPTWSQ